MTLILPPRKLRGEITVPPSKSYAQRMLLAAALCPQTTDILNPGDARDTQAMLHCVQALGRGCIAIPGGWRVAGETRPNGCLSCGESATALRLLLPLCAALPGDYHVTGAASLLRRPEAPLLRVLADHGAAITAEADGFRAAGQLLPGRYELPGHISSQYFSGLLFALPLLPGDSTLRFTSPLVSAPYIAVTLDVLRRFGIVLRQVTGGWNIPGGQAYRSPGAVTVPGDWSAAAFWLAANHLGSAVALRGLENDAQGDRDIVAFLQALGGEMDVSQHPDLFPVLAVCAAAAPVETALTGVARLRGKESDRVAALAALVRALGASVAVTRDVFRVRGVSRLRGGPVPQSRDHRVIMAAAIASTAAAAPVLIPDPAPVAKSYPAFWTDFMACGSSNSCNRF